MTPEKHKAYLLTAMVMCLSVWLLLAGSIPIAAQTLKDPMPLDDKIVFDEPLDTWWVSRINKPIRASLKQEEIDLERLIFGAIQNAPRVQVLSTEPFLAETLVDEANAKFDPSFFLKSKWNDTNDPVGNRLTTGGPPFLEEHLWNHETGFRRLLKRGGRVEIKQRFGFQNSNSDFLTPQDQGTAKLAITFNQPLLNGAGQQVTRSQIIIAQLEKHVTVHKFNRQLQEYVNEIVHVYWELYYDRSTLLQRHRNYQRALEIYKLLEGRTEFDAVGSQLARARAAVLARKIDVRVFKTRVLNTETRLRELVRDSGIGELGRKQSVELIPNQFPVIAAQKFDLSSLLASSMDNRPEIQQALTQIKKASQEQQVAKNDLLPVLNLVLESYVAGLDGDTGIERAFQQQFGQVKPSYSAGLVMEYPLRNRAATARLTRSQTQARKLSKQLEDVVGKVVADIEIALREVETAYENFQNTVASVQSANADVRYIRKRWENFAFVEDVDARTPNTLLEQLLDAQQRQSDAEVAFSTAVRNYMNATANLRLANGTILEQQTLVPPNNNLQPQRKSRPPSNQPQSEPAPPEFMGQPNPMFKH